MGNGSTHLTIPNPILTMMTRTRAKALFMQETTSAKYRRPFSKKKSTVLEGFNFEFPKKELGPSISKAQAETILNLIYYYLTLKYMVSG